MKLSFILSYIFVYPLLLLLSLLPMQLLLRISDLLYFIIYRLIGYRTKVVKENLKNSFPQYSETDLLKIERSFYQFLCDTIMEVVKGISISEEECNRRYKINDESIQQIQKYLNLNQSIILVLSHTGNWELGGMGFGRQTNMYVNVIYRPLSSSFFDFLMKKMRSKFGNLLVPMADIFKVMLDDKKHNRVRATAFAIDQAAPPGSAHWMTFLNQESSVFLGAEKLASKLNYPVIHVWPERVTRAHYHIQVKVLCEQTKDIEPGLITEMITHDIERVIVSDPGIWLWSHKRWKHKRK
jgi:Kdo2-lipid IVA lauroyltransferase/acyltransferase